MSAINWCSLQCCVWLLSLTLLTPAAASPITQETGERRFEQVWRTVRDGFYDEKLHGVDWQAVKARYQPRAAVTRDSVELRRVINEMLGELHASHLEYYTADQFEYYFLGAVFAPDQPFPPIEHIGVLGSTQNGPFEVRALFEGGPAAKAGLRVGDRILSADGQPFSTVGAFRGRAGQLVSLSIERDGEGTRTVTVVPVKETAPEAFANATHNSVRVIRQGKRRLAYVHLWSLTHREILAAYEAPLRDELGDTDGLILDLRDGFGGFPERFDYVLYRPDLVLEHVGRDGKSSPERSGYGKPMVAIINGGSRSAKEYLAYELKKTRRAALVGTNTAGFFLGAGYARIDDDGLLMLPKTDLKLDGKRLEGIGVAPDVVVRPKESYTPQDAQIHRAAEILVKKIRG